MDLTQLDTKAEQEEGTDVVIIDNAGEPVGLTIRVAGPDSDRQRKARKQVVNNRLKGRHLDADILEVEDDVVIAKSIITWTITDPELTLDGEKFPEFSYQAALKLIKRIPIIREQVNVAAGNRARFSKT